MAIDCTKSGRWALFFILFIGCCYTISGNQGSLIFISRTGTLTSRVFCREVIQCVGSGTEVFWSFFGLGSARVMDSDTRFTNTSQMTVNGTSIMTANLTFDPLLQEHQTVYVCQVTGSNPSSTNVRVVVQSVPVVIVSDIPDVNLSTHIIGTPLTVTCQVETCVSDLTVTFYKDFQVVQTTTVTNNMMTSIFAYEIILDANSAGEYACRAVTSEGGTPNEIFTLFGTPMQPLNTETSVSSIVSSTSVSSTVSSTVANTVIGTVAPTVTSSVVTSTPTVSVSPSPGGASGLLIECTVLLSLLLITIASLMI